jgi:hypothetical protein
MDFMELLRSEVNTDIAHTPINIKVKVRVKIDNRKQHEIFRVIINSVRQTGTDEDVPEARKWEIVVYLFPKPIYRQFPRGQKTP